MRKIIVLNGVHGAGKTTLAMQLAQEFPNIYVFYPEIGKQLRDQVSYNSLESGEVFDLEVMRMEMERDKQLMREDRIPLVETWHIGNLGYMAARSPQLIEAYKRDLDKILQKQSIQKLLQLLPQIMLLFLLPF